MNNFEQSGPEIFKGLKADKIILVKRYLNDRLNNINVKEELDGDDTIFPINIVTDNMSDTDRGEAAEFEKDLIADIQQIVGDNFNVFWYMEKIFIEPLTY